MLWATTMMEIYDDLGKTVTDRLALASHAYLSPPSTFTNAAEALLQADDDLHDGENESALRRRLVARGYLIGDDVPLSVTLSVSPSTVAEDVMSAPEVTVTATVDEGTFSGPVAVAVSVGTSGDSAEEGMDYATVEDFEIMILGGSSSGEGTFTLDPSDDNLAEGNETVSVTGTLSAGTVTSAQVTITDDDAESGALLLTISPKSVREDAGTVSIELTASLDAGASTEAMPVMVRDTVINGGTALRNEDYRVVSFASHSSPLEIPVGETSVMGTVRIEILQDDRTEDDETIVIEVYTTAPGLTLAREEFTITDDDAPLSVTLSVSPSTVAEDVVRAPEVTVTATVGGGTFTDPQTVVVSVGTSSDSAEEGTDYAAVEDFTITIVGGSSSGEGMFTLDPRDDDLAEGDETVGVRGTLSGGTVTPTEVTITDDDAESGALLLTISPESVREDAGTVSIEVMASLNGAVRLEATPVTINVTNGTALLGDDYRLVSNPSSLVIPAENLSVMGTVRIEVLEDDLTEDNETVVIGATATGLTSASEEFTITDNDASLSVTLSTSPSTVAEDVGTAEVTVTATVDGDRMFVGLVAVTVSVGTSDDSAEEGTDYAAVEDFMIMIPAGDPSATGRFMLNLVDDDLAEGSETISVEGALSGRTVTPAQVTITDDDVSSTALLLTIRPESLGEDAGMRGIEVTASLNGAVRSEATPVTINVTGGTANSADYTVVTVPSSLVILADEHSVTGTVEIEVLEDDVAEGNETIVIGILASGLTGAREELTITDNDAVSTALALTVVLAGVHEDSGTSWVRFRAGLNGDAIPMDTPVDVGVTGGTAIEGTDYSISVVPSSITIPAGETSISDSLQITITDDDEVEGNETIVVGVSAQGLTGTTQELVIIDDETAVRIDVLTVIANDDGNYTITATVRQNMGAPVASVVLYYGDGVTFEMTPMQTLVIGSNSLYRAELIAPDEGGILYYYVVATNSDGLTARYPLADGRYWDINDYIEGSRLLLLDFEDGDAGDKSAARHYVAYKGDAGELAEGALALDGVDDHAEILGSSLGASEEFALELMFNADDFDAGALDAGGGYLVAKPGGGCDTCWEQSTFSLLWGGSSNSDTYVVARFWNSEYEGEQIELEVPLSLVAGQWYHAVLEVQKEDAGQRAVLQLRDESGMLYGEDAAVLPAPPSISVHPVFVGHIGDRGFFDGRIDNIAFYNYAHFASPPTSTEDVQKVPESYVLEQNYPNPFNPVTTIRYDLAKVGHVRLEVSDLLGRRVAMLVNGVQQAGAQEVRFNAGDLPSGMYLYRLRVEDFVSVKKMVLLK